MQASLAIADERAARAEQELDQLHQDKQELRHQVVRITEERDALQTQLAGGGPQARVITELEERVLTYKAQVEQAAVENQALQARIQQLVEEPSGLSAREKSEYDMEIRRLSEELREATLQIGNLREAKVKSGLDLEEAAAELVELRRQLDEMRRDRNQFRDRLDETRSQAGEMEQLKTQMRELMMQMSQVRGGVAAPAAPEPSGAAPQPRTPEPEAPRKPAAPAAGSVAVPGASLARRREMLNRLIGDNKPKA
jgi:chromosome segregation ATPase